jgi:hypothetical protein
MLADGKSVSYVLRWHLKIAEENLEHTLNQQNEMKNRFTIIEMCV